MTQAYINTESIETALIGTAFGHNDRSVMSKAVRAYVHHDRTHENEVHDYGLSSDDVLAEIAEGESNGHKLHHRAKPFKNFLILFEEHHTLDDLQNLVDKITDEHPGIRPMQLALHRDEGHYDDNGNWIPNLHAHLIYTTNEKGTNKQYRLGGKKETQGLNDLAAKNLSMVRGTGKYEAGGRMDPTRPKSERQPKLSHWAFRRTKQAEQEQRLELKKQTDTASQDGFEHWQESERLGEENQRLIDELEQIKQALAEEKEKYKTARSELIASGEAKQTDYQQLKIDHQKNLEQIESAEYQRDIAQEQSIKYVETEDLLAEVENRLNTGTIAVGLIKSFVARMARKLFRKELEPKSVVQDAPQEPQRGDNGITPSSGRKKR